MQATSKSSADGSPLSSGEHKRPVLVVHDADDLKALGAAAAKVKAASEIIRPTP